MEEEIIQGWDRASRLARSKQQYHMFPPNKYAGKLFCGECGARISREIRNTYGVNPYVAYICKNYRPIAKPNDCCTRTMLMEDKLFSMIDQAIEKERDFARWLVKEMNLSSHDSVQNQLESYHHQDIDQVYDSLRTDSKLLFQYYTQWKQGLITESDYEMKRGAILQEEERHNNEYHSATGRLAGFHSNFKPSNSWIKAVLSLPYDRPLTAKEISKHILWIHIYSDDCVEITWRKNLARETLYTYLGLIDAIPEGITNPPYRNHNNALYKNIGKEP